MTSHFSMAVVGSIAVLLSSLSSPARACSIAACWGPQAQSVGEGGAVPASAPGIPVWFRHGVESLAEAQRRVKFSTARGAVPFHFVEAGEGASFLLLTPDEGFQMGADYTVAVTTSCNEDAPAFTSTFRASASAALPVQLGTLRHTAPHVRSIQVVHDAMCTQAVRAQTVALDVQLDPAARPWADLFTYETWVDDQRYVAAASVADASHPGGSWVGRGKDLLYTACSADDGVQYPGLEAGEHTVRMRASIPGTDVVVETPSVRVTLRCPAE